MIPSSVVALSIAAVAAGTLLPAGAALAQDRADRKERVEQFSKKFDDADADHDGKLTKAEAESKMPGVASHFDAMDVDKKGYLTKQDIAKSLKSMAGNRKRGGAG